jgi:hypothetical protein
MAKDTTKTGGAISLDSGGFAEQRTVSRAALGGKLPDFNKDGTVGRHRMMFLGAHPKSWELAETAEGFRLLPVLKPLFVQPGVWVKSAPKGQQPDPSFMLAKNERNGFAILRDTDSYLYEIDGAGGSKGYFLRWEKVRVYGDGAFDVVLDHDAGNAFRAGLVAKGLIEAPRESVLSDLRSRLLRLKQRAIRGKLDDVKADAERRLAGLDEAIKALSAKSEAKAVA